MESECRLREDPSIPARCQSVSQSVRACRCRVGKYDDYFYSVHAVLRTSALLCMISCQGARPGQGRMLRTRGQDSTVDGDLEFRPPFPVIFLARVQDKTHGYDIRDEQTFVF